MKPWKVLNSRYLVDDQWITIRMDRCLTSKGVLLDPYYVVESAAWGQVVPLTSDNQLLLVKQYRHPLQKFSLEIPSGRIEQGELPQQGIERELLEETGHTAEEWIPLPGHHPNPARLNNRIHSFLARNVTQIKDQKLDATEEIEWLYKPVEEVLALISRGEFGSSHHVASVYDALRYLGKLTT